MSGTNSFTMRLCSNSNTDRPSTIDRCKRGEEQLQFVLLYFYLCWGGLLTIKLSFFRLDRLGRLHRTGSLVHLQGLQPLLQPIILQSLNKLNELPQTSPSTRPQHQPPLHSLLLNNNHDQSWLACLPVNA